MPTNQPLSENFLTLVLKGTSLPHSLYEHVIAYPGDGGRHAEAAFKNRSTPDRYLEDLLAAFLRSTPSGWHIPRAELCALLAMRRRRAGLSASQAVQLYMADLKEAQVPFSQPSMWLRDEMLADLEVTAEFLNTLQWDAAAVLVAHAKGPALGLALEFWDQRFITDEERARPFQREIAQRIANGVGYGARAKSTSKACRRALASMRCSQVAVHALALIEESKSGTPLHPRVADIAVDRAVLPFLAGQIRGTGGYAAMRRIATRFSHEWTAEGAERILAAAGQSVAANVTGAKIQADLVASASARREHMERTSRLGVGLTRSTSVPAAILDRRLAPQVADWLLEQLGDTPLAWDTARRALDALDDDTPIEDVMSFLVALSS